MIDDFGGDRGARGGALDGVLQVRVMFQNPVSFPMGRFYRGGFPLNQDEFRNQGF